jgi:hypothetical protein
LRRNRKRKFKYHCDELKYLIKTEPGMVECQPSSMAKFKKICEKDKILEINPNLRYRDMR